METHSGYIVERREPRNPKRDEWATVAKVSATNFIDTKVFSDEVYQYRVAAIGSVGQVSPYSKPAKAKTRKPQPHIRKLATAIAELPATCPSEIFNKLCLEKSAEATQNLRKRIPSVYGCAQDIDTHLPVVGYMAALAAGENKIIAGASAMASATWEVKQYIALVRECQPIPHALRAVALNSAYAAYDAAGIDLQKALGGYVYEKAKFAILDEITREQDITNSCEHSSKEDRAKKAASAKPRALSVRLNADDLFDGRLYETGFATKQKPEPNHNEESVVTGQSPTRRRYEKPIYTLEEIAARKQYSANAAAKLSQLERVTSTYAKDSRAGDDDAAVRGSKPSGWHPAAVHTDDLDATDDEAMITTRESLADASHQDITVTALTVMATTSAKDKAFIEARYGDGLSQAGVAKVIHGSQSKAAVKKVGRQEARLLAVLRAKHGITKLEHRERT